MKASLIAIATFTLVLSGAHGRTWTSSDGSKTFEGDLRSYDEKSGVVTVVINGRSVEFPKSKLSAEDIAFLNESTMPEAAVGPDTETEVGAKVAKAKLQRLEGKRYKKAELEKNPKYYILYYSASW
ncbi:hypothetical protein VSU19_13430 [Verrucomicrobiales bacterium BCK34]|nr:hypothetical protein [Verrucomicrobiales bacterium BCK34]